MKNKIKSGNCIYLIMLAIGLLFISYYLGFFIPDDARQEADDKYCESTESGDLIRIHRFFWKVEVCCEKNFSLSENNVFFPEGNCLDTEYDIFGILNKLN